MKLSVIILNYNVKYFLQKCIQSVQDAITNIDAEIIVVDNASSDDSCKMVKQNFPNVILLESKKNLGFPKGNNRGVAMAKGEYTCILNPDTVVAEDTFIKALAFADAQKDCGIVGVKLIDGTGNFLPESKRGIPTPWVAFTRFSGLYKLAPKLFGKYYASHLKENENGEVSILVGAFMLLKKSIYKEVGGFDEGAFMYADDIDLSYAVKEYGYKNYYFSDTTIIHYKGESTNKDQKTLHHSREAMKFFYKKHFKTNFLFDLFLRVGIKFFSLTKFLRTKALENHSYSPKKYLFVSNNKLFQNILQKKLQKKVTLKNVNTIFTQDKKDIPTEIIFDANHLTSTQIINLFQKLKNKHFTFKILPKNANFILGSNHSDIRGEAITFPTEFIADNLKKAATF